MRLFRVIGSRLFGGWRFAEFYTVAFFDKDVAVGSNFQFDGNTFVWSGIAEPTMLTVGVTRVGVVVEAGYRC